MSVSRRDINLLVPALVAARTAQSRPAEIRPSKAYLFDELAVKVNPQSHNESRQVFRGETHDGFEIACHITKLQPGQMPHPPHRHLNEEVLFMHAGAVEITIEGKTSTLRPGSVAYIHSNELHGLRNDGPIPAEYFILELDGPKT